MTINTQAKNRPKKKNQDMQRSKNSLASLILLLLLSLVYLIDMAEPTSLTDTSTAAATVDAAADSSKAAAVHIVYMEWPESEEAESYHIRTLASVLGSEDAAKEALIYSYKTAASGFSAKLTPEQVEQISKQPGVLQVVPSQTLQLHTGPVKLH